MSAASPNASASAPASSLPSDSAGQAWAGKSIPSHGFAGDTGGADVALLEMLRVALDQPTPEHEQALMARVATARWLVPVVAIATEVDASGEHVTETSTDMATVTLTAPDGSVGLPMFTSLTALAVWDASARPVPVPAAVAAQSAISEQCSVLLVDLGSDHAGVLRPSMLWALAQRREWVPTHTDRHVASAVATAVATEPEVIRHRLEAGDPAGAGVLNIVLGLSEGLDEASVNALATRLGERIATDGETRARIDALAFTLETA